MFHLLQFPLTTFNPNVNNSATSIVLLPYQGGTQMNEDEKV